MTAATVPISKGPADDVTSLLRIINMVRNGEAVTRPEIAKATGLGRGVIAQRIDRAIRLGYLSEGAVGASSGGRRPRTLRFRAERGLIVTCALKASQLGVAITALDGALLEHTYRTWQISRGPEETLEMLTSLANDLLMAGPKRPVWGVVVGLPGAVDFSTGQPVASLIRPGWNNFDVRAFIEKRFHAPVWVDNNVNLLALRERARRRDKDVNLIYCEVGSEIGVSLMSEGRLHRGANGAAGAIGHVRTGDSYAPCRCGKTGCLEVSASGAALVQQAQVSIGTDHASSLVSRAKKGAITIHDVISAAKGGDALAIRLVQQSGRLTGESLSTLVNIFNPAMIVFGGTLASAGELFLAEVRQRIIALSLPSATRELEITCAYQDEREALRGGTELAREQLFDVTFPRWFGNGQPSPELTIKDT